MRVSIHLPDVFSSKNYSTSTRQSTAQLWNDKIYLDKLKNYPRCRPKFNGQFATFDLPLDGQFYLCGTVRMINKVTGSRLYYHKIIIEDQQQLSELNDISFDTNTTLANNLTNIITPTTPETTTTSTTTMKTKSTSTTSTTSITSTTSTFSTTSTILSTSPSPSNSSTATKKINKRSNSKKILENKRTITKPEIKSEKVLREIVVSCRIPDALSEWLNEQEQSSDRKSKSVDRRRRNSEQELRRELERISELPEDFAESVEEQIDYSGNFTGEAAIPHLSVSIKREGHRIDSSGSVQPGAALEMQIRLDNESSNVYGILCSYLKVSDGQPDPTRNEQQETILLDGCSIDPYIFSDFELDPKTGFLLAKFRAFKFPESSYVLFIGTVNVCLKRCTPTVCSDLRGEDGSTQSRTHGWGRRKRNADHNRSISSNSADKLFEVQMTTILHLSHLNSTSATPVNGRLLQADHRRQSLTSDRVHRQADPQQLTSYLNPNVNKQYLSTQMRSSSVTSKHLNLAPIFLVTSLLMIRLNFLTR